MAESNLLKKQIICAHHFRGLESVMVETVAAGGMSGKLRHHISAHVPEAKKELDA